ncbi:MAG TPA: hypothetical protein VK892_19475 [Pyrinomonadaceae bacterium]|nr:hypothetical protein [Pyrinomonadaceae bacterium]
MFCLEWLIAADKPNKDEPDKLAGREGRLCPADFENELTLKKIKELKFTKPKAILK